MCLQKPYDMQGGKLVLVFYLASLDSDTEKDKFEYIYRKYYLFMLRTASTIIKNSSLAEDAVHETFIQI